MRNKTRKILCECKRLEKPLLSVSRSVNELLLTCQKSLGSSDCARNVFKSTYGSSSEDPSSLDDSSAETNESCLADLILDDLRRKKERKTKGLKSLKIYSST